MMAVSEVGGKQGKKDGERVEGKQGGKEGVRADEPQLHNDATTS